ncbi:DNA-binding IclR family transcriptional regulator [Sporomusaceae bacterium BoRhaA]|uniref:IclR family transcriptional regulator n=1 Tax=Pelorhabdus rhamnosifermentans TaxID=2772457 RepID=UPI001C05F5A3|nr:IclR family transcriptional regulator [Pelorhabdus rhamnosifermentans]MBU2699635.1 DNA-binding IclR family transcriptional regulator [Pelorhabdus rhamnosifermentans]
MYNIRAVERAFKLLECFSNKKPQMGVTELSEYIGLSKATTFRIAETLEQLGYLNKSESTQTYSISSKVLTLGQVFLDDLEFRTISLPYMRKIRDTLDESVSLYIVAHNKRVCVERIQTSRLLRRVVTVGEEVPLDRGASGKVLLAFSHLNYGVDEAVLESIRKNGYAYSENERGEGISAVSVPIRNFKGNIVAALTISGPSFRYNDESLPRYINLMKEMSRTISSKLGFNA